MASLLKFDLEELKTIPHPASTRSRILTTGSSFSAIHGSGPAYLSELLYMSTLCLVHYALSLTPHAENPTIQKARLVSFALFLALDRTFENHSHKTFYSQTENLPLLTVFSPQLISVPIFCYSHCVCV